ncbi:hypothetical protein VM1G_01976 [Cytospora mali]|uniref:Uncharacterized protein n=1 Tax=Cytospora mali TaxID=578113 RepID=A0A194VR09_CYTMA|nr:hypothetical protein VM1G_01976 [Valsa mali]
MSSGSPSQPSGAWSPFRPSKRSVAGSAMLADVCAIVSIAMSYQGTGVRCWDCAAGNRSCEAVPGSAVPFLASALNDRKPFVERDAAVTKAAQELRKNRAVPAAAPAPVAVAAPAAPAAGPPAAFWDEALELLRRSVAAQERIAESAEDIASAVTKLAKKDDDEDEDEDEESVEL